jgi:hypothetical protein
MADVRSWYFCEVPGRRYLGTGSVVMRGKLNRWRTTLEVFMWMLVLSVDNVGNLFDRERRAWAAKDLKIS